MGLEQQDCADDGCKKPWQSKTLWTSLIVAVAPLIPPVQALLVANPELAGTIVALVFAGLRVFAGRGSSGAPIVLKKTTAEQKPPQS